MVNIDTVYQRVLALANKEQRGYITPQEFNLFANQAQMDIFEQYFYDINQFGRVPGNKTMYADPVGILEEKIEIFHRGQTLGDGTSNVFNINDLDFELYRLKQVRYNRTDGVGVKVEKTIHDKFTLSRNSPLTAPTLMRPIYYLRNTSIIVNPSEITEIDVNYIKKPTTVQWNGYDTPSGQLYNENESTNFELHPSEEPNLVLNILKLAGIAMKDPSLYQLGAAEEAKDIQQEKQ
tara:strand:- start:7298 stop:8002 length:705 start_codon:yes stop_codon:yes gene_type:complete